MERQFGEKSFKPSPFEFHYIYRGYNNQEFRNLFNRKLTGQILLSAYYEPMTIEQMSFELGVANVYLEDEVTVLEKYGFLKKHGEKKYQTNMLILTKSYHDTVFSSLDKNYSGRLKNIIDGVRAKLPEVRKVGFAGFDLPETPMLWDLLAYMFITEENQYSEEIKDSIAEFGYLYGDTYGICYAYDHSDHDPKYMTNHHAGLQSTRSYQTSFIGFGVLNGKCRNTFFYDNELPAENDGTLFPAFTEEELNKVYSILSDEFNGMLELIKDIAALSIEILKEHSPEIAENLIDSYFPLINLWNIAGWFGAAAVSSGALDIPKKDECAGIVGFKFFR